MPHKPSYLRSILFAALVPALVSPTVALPRHSPAGALEAPYAVANAAGAITEFAVPTADSHPIGITTGPDGNLWFAENYGHKIGRITPGGQIAEFTLPSPLSNPQNLVTGSDGNLWFTDNADAIGRITTQGVVTAFPLPSADPRNPARNNPRGIAAGADGNLWFTEHRSGRIGRITPQGVITEFPLADNQSLPNGITAGQDGNVWFTEQGTDKIGRITSQGAITEFGGLPTNSEHSVIVQVPESSNPAQVGPTPGPPKLTEEAQESPEIESDEYSLWFFLLKDPWIWLIRPEYGQTDRSAALASGVVDSAAPGPEGFPLYLAIGGADVIKSVAPDKTVKTYGGLTPGSYPVGLTAGPDHNIWFTEYNGNRIGRLILPPEPQPVPTWPSRTFAQTGMTVNGVFLTYWDQHGGLAQQGYPISNQMVEKSDVDGKTYIVQYFERAVFDYHPENKPPYNVLLSLLGNLRYKAKYPGGAPGQQPNTVPGAVLFPQTGHRVGGTFLSYWQQHGGLAQQGYPIAEEFQEKSDLDGKTYRVQYFERAVFELHPENTPPFDVLLSQLGTFQYQQHHGGN